MRRNDTGRRHAASAEDRIVFACIVTDLDAMQGRYECRKQASCKALHAHNMDMVEIHACQETFQVGVVRYSSLSIFSSSFSFFIIYLNDYNDYCNHYYIDNP